jgi:mono/diheme cytochrome c family protein
MRSESIVEKITMTDVIRLRRWLALTLTAAGLMGATAFGQPPYGLDSREPIGPYLNNVMPPANGAFAFPPVLSATGAFSNVANLSPATGLIPFVVNSPLWSDGAIKTRWVAVPNDGPPYAAGEQIGFVPEGEWGFPNGTVFVKHFELTVNEITGARKRLETRLLVRSNDGEVYGVTYKWRPDNSDADLLPGPPLDEDITITTSSGATRVQTWSYPGRGQCLTCHNTQANFVLGLKTHQLNGNFFYPSTGRTDNQLRTFAHLGLLNPAPSEAEIPTFLKSVAVSNAAVPVQHRMRSWIDANCSQCHRPGGQGPGYDGRLYTPYENQDLVTFMAFRDHEGSALYQRDNSLGAIKMPPLAKNVVDETAMAVLRQWIASPLEVLSVYLHQDTSHLAVKFNSHVDPATATVVENYRVDDFTIPSEAVMSSEPDTVILTVPPRVPNQTYYLTTSEVQDTAPSANTIWLWSQTPFVAETRPPVTGSRLANISTRLQVGVGEDVLIAGFIVQGTPTKRILIRGIGPSLSSLGIAGALADPTLELRDQTGAVVASDDDWETNANQQEIIDTGIPPVSPKESVILRKIPSTDAGVAYTVILRGVENSTGVGLLEVYDLDNGIGPKVLNISTRGRVDVGENVMIGGVIVLGQGTQRVIVRAIGPSLPVAGKLADPTLELHDGNGGLIASNNDWRSDHEQEIIDTGIPPSDNLESAIVATLPPASYTAIVRGVNNTTGVGLVEVYALN